MTFTDRISDMDLVERLQNNAEATTFYAEYLSVGSGANTDSRVSWSHLLTAEQVANDYTLNTIFKDWIFN